MLLIIIIIVIIIIIIIIIIMVNMGNYNRDTAVYYRAGTAQSA
jgi:Na+(H+)/acetate symporter ActP